MNSTLCRKPRIPSVHFIYYVECEWYQWRCTRAGPPKQWQFKFSGCAHSQEHNARLTTISLFFTMLLADCELSVIPDSCKRIECNIRNIRREARKTKFWEKQVQLQLLTLRMGTPEDGTMTTLTFSVYCSSFVWSVWNRRRLSGSCKKQTAEQCIMQAPQPK